MFAELLASRLAQPVLTTRLGRRRARDITRQVIARHRASPPRARERSVGGRLMVACASLTIALYRTLVDDGHEEGAARDLTAIVTRAVYDKMAEGPWLIARLTARSPIARLRRATNAFRRFPFGASAYTMKDLPSDDRTVAFDVMRCPVAEHFRSEGLVELCAESFCDLDFPLAERWGARLSRTTTLAAGDSCCNFRWRIIEP